MKEWQCTVCKYVHKDDELPGQCPVCGADTANYVELGGESAEQPESGASTEVSPVSSQKSEKDSASAAKKWRCTVCGYIHEGDEPPEKCPVCGADKSLFEPLPEADAAPAADAEPVRETETEQTAPEEAAEPGSKWAKYYQLLIRQMLTHHAHPISVHFPNGVLPMSVIFLILAVVFQISNLGLAAFYNMVFVLLTLPFVLFSGYVEWKNHYGGNLTKFFIMKISSAAIVTVCALIIVIWWIVDPEAASPGGGHRLIFVLLHLVMLGAATLAGMLGGKLVFKD